MNLSRYRVWGKTIKALANKLWEKAHTFWKNHLWPNLPETQTSTESVRQDLTRHLTFGLMVCGFLVFCVFGWASLASLSGAVVAPGVLTVESHTKKIQHPTGGIVAELSIKEGSLVKSGDLLIQLDATTARTSHAIVSKALHELEGRRVRLEAERDGQDILVFPKTLFTPETETDHIRAGEESLFHTRHMAYQAQDNQLKERIIQMNEQIKGLEVQSTATQEQMNITQKEIESVTYLHNKNLALTARLTGLQREMSQLTGRRGQLLTSVAELKGKISEIELQRLQADKDRHSSILNDLRELDGKQGELLERKIAAEDQLKRIDIRSPQDGMIHQLAVHTVGGVVGPGETLMTVVPQGDDLIIEAKVAPHDIDQLQRDQSAVVRLSAFNQRVTPEFKAVISHISGDLQKHELTGEAYYSVRLSFLPDKNLTGLTLVPGMPAEVFIQTGSRTPLSFFMKPLTDNLKRAFNEE